MNLVESKLFFTTPPLSIKQFNQQKNLNLVRQDLDKATLYIIGKRETPVIHVIDCSPLVEYVKDYDNEFVLLNISMPESGFNTEAVYILPKTIKKAEFISSIASITIEQILCCVAHNVGAFGCLDDISPLITYEVLYVGQCVGEPLTKRFKAHHALQNMLIEEKVIFRKYDKADELILMPFFLDSQTLSVLTPENIERDFMKAFTNDFDFGAREVNLDAEKALVHNMNPRYNKIRFLNYPKSDDGLYNSDAHAFSYSINEFILLKYQDGVVVGCPDNQYASKIVGDNEGFTKVYGPGEDITKRYVGKIMSYMGEDAVRRFYENQ